MYRTTGASFEKAQQEFATGVMSNKTVQTATANAASRAAQGAFKEQVWSRELAHLTLLCIQLPLITALFEQVTPSPSFWHYWRGFCGGATAEHPLIYNL